MLRAMRGSKNGPDSSKTGDLSPENGHPAKTSLEAAQKRAHSPEGPSKRHHKRKEDSSRDLEASILAKALQNLVERLQNGGYVTPNGESEPPNNLQTTDNPLRAGMGKQGAAEEPGDAPISVRGAMSSVYGVFLQSLDDSQLVQHINTFETSQISSDPFDDGLDDVLANMGQEEGVESSDDEPIGVQHKFGDYATYFHNKQLKQQDSDAKYVQWDRQRRLDQGLASQLPRKPIFSGCVIYVNGHTTPPISEIHRLVIVHGGQFLSYLTNKGAATHIICDRLTPRKHIEFRNYKVVKAQWIVDSVEKQQLLNWQDYRLIGDLAYGQKRLQFGKDAIERATSKVPPSRKEDVFNSQGLENAEVTFDDELHGIPNSQNEVGLVKSQGDALKAQEATTKTQTEVSEDDIKTQGEVSEQEEDNIFLLTQAESEIQEAEQQSQSRVDFFEANARSKDGNGHFDARHPTFIRHFFANSRLHHLSTWKADLRFKFLRKISKTTPLSQKNATPSDRVILHVDFDCFFVSASSLNYPQYDISKVPMAVTHGGKTSDVASCNYVARSMGVANGMWLGRAKKLCPEIVTLDYDFEAYERYANEFYNYFLNLGSFDSIFPVLIDEALLDATSLCSRNGEIESTVVQKLCENIRKDILELTRCPVSIGASRNVLLAKLATKEAKPMGQFYLDHDIELFLSKTPVKSLPGIGHSIVQKIKSEVLQSDSKEPLVDDIMGLSEQRLMNIFGAKTGAKLYQYARGIDETSISLDLSNSESVLGRKSVSVEINYGIRFDTMTQVDVFLINLAKELYSRMIGLGICGSALTLKLARRAPNAPRDPPKYLGMGRCDFISRTSKLGVPTNDWGIVGSEMKALYRICNIPVQELRGVAVMMTKLEDVEVLKKDKQTRLPFAQVGAEGAPLPEKEVSHYRGREDIDWDVFNALPEDIKMELKQELFRRGLTSSPQKTARRVLPKKEPGSKVYLQQLLPTQPYGEPKYTRVIESPKKRARLPSKSPLPVKRRPRSPLPDDSVSYDEGVLQELPSSVRQEVLKDLEYKKKVKKFDLVPLKEKFRKLEQPSVVNSEKITLQWLEMQPRLVNPPLLLGQDLSYKELVNQIKGWVHLSLAQEGPHRDDVAIFVAYLKELMVQNNLNRCLSLVTLLEKRVLCEKNVCEMAQEMTTQEKNAAFVGIEDWETVIKTEIRPFITEFCRQTNRVEDD